MKVLVSSEVSERLFPLALPPREPRTLGKAASRSPPKGPPGKRHDLAAAAGASVCLVPCRAPGAGRGRPSLRRWSRGRGWPGRTARLSCGGGRSSCRRSGAAASCTITSTTTPAGPTSPSSAPRGACATCSMWSPRTSAPRGAAASVLMTALGRPRCLHGSGGRGARWWISSLPSSR